VDEAVDRRQRLNLVPPELRQIKRISRLELHPQRLLANLLEERKVPFRWILGRGGETHRSARHGVVDRADVELADQLWREQRESPAAGDHTGEIVEGVVMAGNVRARAEPDARTH